METQPSFNREDLLTPDEVAKILRVQRTTALNYMRRGVIPAAKIGKHWYSSRPLLDEHLASLFREGGGR
jgi:excisionase family DNA binding protein